MNNINIVIADDDKLFAHSLKYLIEQDENIKVIGCAENGYDAYEICKKYSINLVLMDIDMPKCNGIKGTRLIKEYLSEIKVLVLAKFHEQSVFEALKNGADGHILKDITPEQLIQAIKNTVSGFNIFSTITYNSILNNFATDNREKGKNKFNLTDRQIDIIYMISEGKRNKEIAKSLCLSIGRTKNIISELYSILELSDRNQLTRFAYENDIIRGKN